MVKDLYLSLKALMISLSGGTLKIWGSIYNLIKISYFYKKNKFMNSAEIKIDLFRKLDSLKGKRLEEAYGILLNYINGKSEVDDWQNLTAEQQSAIRHGVEQLDNGQGKNHKDVMAEMRKRFTND